MKIVKKQSKADRKRAKADHKEPLTEKDLKPEEDQAADVKGGAHTGLPPAGYKHF
ncbi:hypothetical protein [Streptomyces sp. NPDC057910]|uniref:hypothetical protein n=1 Tax=Streptomyces sp. NPDC057910 TaxID=3346278 RepID=UPI0036EFC97E